jgi:hypothetical protein
MDEASRQRLLELSDPQLPCIHEVVEGGADLWEAVSGERLERVRAVQARWSPGRSLTVRYDSPSGSFVAYSGGQLPDGVPVVRPADGGGTPAVAVWRIAEDPWLPGLRVALDPAAVRTMLAPLGVPAAPVALRLRAYRPGRRAVVEVTSGAHRVFVKVARPSSIEALQRRHQAMDAGDPRLPIPVSHGWSSELGLVVLEARPGITLREALATDLYLAPSVETVRSLLDGLPEIGDGRTARSQVHAGIEHVALIRRLAPDASRALDEFDLRAMVGRSTVERSVHGDLHEAQILVQGGAITGLLDIDTVGLGDPRDDWATLLGHLVVRAAEAGHEERARIRGYAAEVARLLLTFTDDAQGRRGALARVASVIIGLAAGPFSAMAPDWAATVDARIGLAARWLRAAMTDENQLMRLSPAVQAQIGI